MFGFLKKIFGTAQSRLLKKYFKIVAEINRWDEKFLSLTDDQLRGKTKEFQERLKQGEFLDALLPEAFAVVKNVCRRLQGTEIHVSGYHQKWDMVPYDVQLVGAIALHFGSVAEMQTGEGKTLTAVLPLYLNALAGKAVHLVTVNDYLAERDAAWVGTIFRWLGLSCAALTNGASQEERVKIYQADIVYGTASEFGFDYLRDNSMTFKKEEQVQRGHFFAVIDEADSILIDEARTPLIISGPAPVSRQMYDELKGGVSDLVRRQRELCSHLASESKKCLDKLSALERQKTKEELDQESEALRKLWLVSKGTPQNKLLKRVKEDPDLRAAIDKWDLYYYSDQNKQEKHQALAELFIIIDEKSQEFELTEKGIHVWEECAGEGKYDDFVMLDISHAFIQIDEDPSLDEPAKVQKKLEVQEEDAKRKERSHNLRKLLQAHLLMEKDVDYIVQDSKIVIIDENTGRPQPGRRFSDGLHQAIEAKEGVPVQRETQTYATITLQNFFRLYDKLAGMTGTASTEAGEFKQIYKMDVLEIPTHKPCIRKDYNDEIYMTEREKYAAILKDVKAFHEKGQPILIGTESVDISEKLSRILKQNRLEHTVLNAKQPEKEAEVISFAGRAGAITIATNMAGRGTDIKLQKGVSDLGGLVVLGTTRHQSRRTDRQLRGRCARQGDPGISKFYMSFEDSLLRLFAPPRITALLQKWRPPEGEPISASILNKSIETAQKRVEQRNYMIRKHTLEYDDVMNKQRQEIYAFRNELLHSKEVMSVAVEILESACCLLVEEHFSKHGVFDPEKFREQLMQLFPISFSKETFFDSDLSQEGLIEVAALKVTQAFKEKIKRDNEKIFGGTLSEAGGFKAEDAVRDLMLRRVDQRWQEHLLSMDHLRSDVTLRAVGQRDPLTEFKHEAFSLFDVLSKRLKEEISHDLFRFEVMPRDQLMVQRLLSSLNLETSRSFASELDVEEQGSIEPEKSSKEPSSKIMPMTAALKTGRNDFCPCGSGKKYKKCCGVDLEPVSN